MTEQSDHSGEVTEDGLRRVIDDIIDSSDVEILPWRDETSTEPPASPPVNGKGKEIANVRPTAYTQFEWGEGTYVQGSRGYKVRGGSQNNAFVEAFPDIGISVGGQELERGTLVRGDAETIAEAEEKAWRQYQHYLSCDVHQFSRLRIRRVESDGEVVEKSSLYTNGAGFCKGCGLYISRFYIPVRSQYLELETMSMARDVLRGGELDVSAPITPHIYEEARTLGTYFSHPSLQQGIAEDYPSFYDYDFLADPLYDRNSVNLDRIPAIRGMNPNFLPQMRVDLPKLLSLLMTYDPVEKKETGIAFAMNPPLTSESDGEYDHREEKKWGREHSLHCPCLVYHLPSISLDGREVMVHTDLTISSLPAVYDGESNVPFVALVGSRNGSLPDSAFSYEIIEVVEWLEDPQGSLQRVRDLVERAGMETGGLGADLVITRKYRGTSNSMMLPQAREYFRKRVIKGRFFNRDFAKLTAELRNRGHVDMHSPAYGEIRYVMEIVLPDQ